MKPDYGMRPSDLVQTFGTSLGPKHRPFRSCGLADPNVEVTDQPEYLEGKIVRVDPVTNKVVVQTIVGSETKEFEYLVDPTTKYWGTDLWANRLPPRSAMKDSDPSCQYLVSTRGWASKIGTSTKFDFTIRAAGRLFASNRRVSCCKDLGIFDRTIASTGDAI